MNLCVYFYRDYFAVNIMDVFAVLTTRVASQPFLLFL